MSKRDVLLLTRLPFLAGNVTIFPYITPSFPYKAPWLNTVIWISEKAKHSEVRSLILAFLIIIQYISVSKIIWFYTLWTGNKNINVNNTCSSYDSSCIVGLGWNSMIHTSFHWLSLTLCLCMYSHHFHQVCTYLRTEKVWINLYTFTCYKYNFMLCQINIFLENFNLMWQYQKRFTLSWNRRDFLSRVFNLKTEI